mmetsp:Transcript_2367/g.5115  ORF Transcript_2367/g.5115 Transcript_2367/m.5115 type:complete len:233 (+) Transcript_2367:169-867(+)|eukprot:CAMPEP_0172585532 /NCGR_PEP_ID=MMETSP1068-20121228/4955_1 /TAXON_ID=35684 /ORGANISM="Pseudopedinella elastica, Strain CCMP716" /LENGTH=232 /DNA_ID=CAMNT_0013380037 /DNA_START=141 /DNA_END=839 /DNA_ORIENTATION=+
MAARHQVDDTPLDYSNIPPIPLPKTILLVNHFVVSTANFLNRFSGECELQLTQVSQRITSVQTNLSLLECKLRSVPGLEQPAEAQPTASSSGQEPTPAPDANPGANSSTDVSSGTKADAGDSGPAGPADPGRGGRGGSPGVPGGDKGGDNDGEATGLEGAGPLTAGPPRRRASEHPRFRKFFKMAQMHVPLQACQHKMAAELPGEDPGILERPGDLVEMTAEEAALEQAQVE